MILGLTGGSGTGKSTVCKYFEDKGFLIIDSDKIARQVCQKGEKCLEEVVNAFGKEILDEEGNLIRSALAKIVFSDEEKLGLLNSITHKYIVLENMNIIKDNPHRDIVLDAPLLFEAGLGDICTKRLCVLSDRSKRIQRIVERDNILVENATARINSQPEDEFYISRCEYVVYNNSSVEELFEKLGSMFGGSNEN